MNLFEGFGDMCPVEGCNGRLLVKIHAHLTTSPTGQTILERERITECDNQECPYFHAERLPDEPITLGEKSDGLTFDEGAK